MEQCDELCKQQYKLMSQNQNQQSIGMMEGAFFVPKGQLIKWVNDILKLNISKIQQLGTGAIYCQIVDLMFPGKINLQRVNWKARNEWQFINNFKLLQQCFAKCKIHKHIDIQKLSKSKYQDNLEFIQWMKRYFDLYNRTDPTTYDAVLSRKGNQADFSFVDIRNFRKIPTKLEVSPPKQSKSPYDKIRSKINNRSSTTSKHHKREEGYYIQKINQIRDILKSHSKKQQTIQKIQQILEEIDEQVPEKNQVIEKMKTVQDKQDMKHKVVTPQKIKPIITKHKKIKTSK